MRRAVALVCCALAVSLAGVLFWWFRHDGVESVSSRTPFRYGFELRNDSNQVIRDARFSVFAPAELPGRQRVVALNASMPFEESSDEYGNRTLEFSIDVLPPYGVKVLVVDGEVELWSPAQRSELTAAEPFLAAESNIQVTDTRIAGKARELREAGPDVIGETLRFVHGHVQDSGYLLEDRGAVYALVEGRGDCTEYMSLFSALARANGVPTRNMAGFRVNPEGARLSNAGYHNWLEYHDGRRWTLVDPQNDIHNAHQERYVAFRVLNERTQLSSTQRFFVTDRRLRVNIM